MGSMVGCPLPVCMAAAYGSVGQQMCVPSSRRPHVWDRPLLMETNRSSSGGDGDPEP